MNLSTVKYPECKFLHPTESTTKSSDEDFPWLSSTVCQGRQNICSLPSWHANSRGLAAGYHLLGGHGTVTHLCTAKVMSVNQEAHTDHPHWSIPVIAPGTSNTGHQVERQTVCTTSTQSMQLRSGFTLTDMVPDADSAKKYSPYSMSYGSCCVPPSYRLKEYRCQNANHGDFQDFWHVHETETPDGNKRSQVWEWQPVQKTKAVWVQGNTVQVQEMGKQYPNKRDFFKWSQRPGGAAAKKPKKIMFKVKVNIHWSEHSNMEYQWWTWTFKLKATHVDPIYPPGPLHPQVPLPYFIPNFPFLAHFFFIFQTFSENSTSTQILNFNHSGSDFKFSFYFLNKKWPFTPPKTKYKTQQSFQKKQKKNHPNLKPKLCHMLLHSYWPDLNFFSLFSSVNHNWSLTSTLTLHSWPG